MTNILERDAIIRYKDDMRRILSIYYPNLTIDDINYAIDYSVNKRYKQETCVLNNNYTKKKAEASLVDMIDYIMDKQPILTGWGVMFSRKGTVPNPLCNMIKSFMELRGIHKKEMFKYPKGTDEYKKYNLAQTLDKIDANGTLKH